MNNYLYDLNYNKELECVDGYKTSSHFSKVPGFGINYKLYKSPSTPSHDFFQTQIGPVMNNYNYFDDFELKPELLDSKSKFNLRINELNNLRVHYKKLNKNKKTNSVMLKKLLGTKLNNINKSKSKDGRKTERNKIIRENLLEMKEPRKVQSLKRDLSGYQMDFTKRINEIKYIKKKSKIVNMIELENNLSKKENEFRKVTKILFDLEDELADNEKKINYFQERFEFYQSIALQAENQLKKNNISVENSDARNEELNNEVVKLENKIKQKESQNRKLLILIKELDIEIKNIKDENDFLERMGYEKELYQDKEDENMKIIKKLKSENEELNEQFAKIEKKYYEYLDKLIKYDNERPKLLEKAKEPSASHKEKDRKIAELRDEIKKIIEKGKENAQMNEQSITSLKNELRRVKKVNEKYKSTFNDISGVNEDLNLKLYKMKLKKTELEENNQKIFEESNIGGKQKEDNKIEQIGDAEGNIPQNQNVSQPDFINNVSIDR